jgi:uncharacterized SAM-binding protein YcdF (DUF218 family)
MIFEYDFLKPWLSALILPPASALILLFLGALLALRSVRAAWQVLGKMICLASFVALWLFCCQGSAAYLERVVLQPPAAIAPQKVAQIFKSGQVQAIVVLGGGMHPTSLEYGQAHLSESSAQRLHYAAVLSKQTGLPIAFSSGRGWGTAANTDSEAAAAARWLAQLGLPSPRWLDAESKDTAGNASAISAILKRDGVSHIALVTHASHMPRALTEFSASGLKVISAPTHFLGAENGMGLDWFPSGQGLRNTRRVMHEILGLAVLRYRSQA